MALPSKILIADNDQGMMNVVEQGLLPHKISVVKAKDWESALYCFNTNRFDICIVELDLQNLPGTALIQKWRMHDVPAKRSTGFIVSTGTKRTPGVEALVAELEDVGIITKPIKIPILLSIMAKIMEQNAQRGKLDELDNKIITPLLEQGKFEKAVVIAREKLEPLGNRGAFRSAVVHSEAKQAPHAVEMLEKLLKLEPTNMKYHNELGRIQLGMGNLDAARAAFELADKAAPLNIERMKNLAVVYLQQKNPDSVVQKYKEILSVCPESPDMKFEMMEQLLGAGFESHAREFSKMTSTPKELIRHYNNKGVVFAKTEDYGSALAEYTKAMSLLPKAKETYRIIYNIAIAHINMKTKDHLIEAKKQLEKCLSIQPDYDKAKEKLELVNTYLTKVKDPAPTP